MSARGDTPVVRLVPLAPQPKGRRFVAMKGKAHTRVAFLEELTIGELRLREKLHQASQKASGRSPDGAGPIVEACSLV